ncbi:MAG: hypothetical protein KDB00_20555 [Planctomycetales bacterium]|nr:hypothetical protein [Planctomycetales bacterium]
MHQPNRFFRHDGLSLSASATSSETRRDVVSTTFPEQTPSNRTRSNPENRPQANQPREIVQHRQIAQQKKNRFRSETPDARGIDLQRSGLNAGWLIRRKPSEQTSYWPPCQTRPDESHIVNMSCIDQEQLQCLQLATGQWRPPSQATWFPAPGAAILYATDLTREIGQTFEVIFLRRGPSSPMAEELAILRK